MPKPRSRRLYQPKAMGLPVGAAIGPLLAKPAAKHGFRDARLMAEWSAIVGPETASRARPERLDRRGGRAVLKLVVAPGWAPEIQHLEPVLIEKINRYFGREMVQRLQLRQGPVIAGPAPPPARRTRQALPHDVADRLDAACAAVEDPELAAILRRLGDAALRR